MPDFFLVVARMVFAFLVSVGFLSSSRAQTMDELLRGLGGDVAKAAADYLTGGEARMLKLQRNGLCIDARGGGSSMGFHSCHGSWNQQIQFSRADLANVFMQIGGQCLNASGGRYRPGPIIRFPCQKDGWNDRFFPVLSTAGSFYILEMPYPPTAQDLKVGLLCLSAVGVDEGADLLLEPCNFGTKQTFTFDFNTK